MQGEKGALHSGLFGSSLFDGGRSRILERAKPVIWNQPGVGGMDFSGRHGATGERSRQCEGEGDHLRFKEWKGRALEERTELAKGRTGKLSQIKCGEGGIEKENGMMDIRIYNI